MAPATGKQKVELWQLFSGIDLLAQDQHDQRATIKSLLPKGNDKETRMLKARVEKMIANEAGDMCNRIKVKWLDGISGSVHVFPIVTI